MAGVGTDLNLPGTRAEGAPANDPLTMELFGHPFSSYTQKVLIALYEAGTPFEWRLLDPTQPEALAEWGAVWPLQRMPLLRVEGQLWAESSVINEWLDRHRPGPRPLLPQDPDAALRVRLVDRFFDQYVMTPMQKLVFDHLRPTAARDAHGVAEARALLTRSYAWMDAELADGRPWAAGDAFSLADCAAAPALFYADWVHPIGPEHPRLRALRQRLLARPSVARCVDEARPYRHYFPPGAPDRD